MNRDPGPGPGPGTMPMRQFQRNPGPMPVPLPPPINEAKQRLGLLSHLEKYPGPLTDPYDYHTWNKMLFLSLRNFRVMSVLPDAKEPATPELNQLVYCFLVKNVRLESFDLSSTLGTPSGFLFVFGGVHQNLCHS